MCSVDILKPKELKIIVPVNISILKKIKTERSFLGKIKKHIKFGLDNATVTIIFGEKLETSIGTLREVILPDFYQLGEDSLTNDRDFLIDVVMEVEMIFHEAAGKLRNSCEKESECSSVFYRNWSKFSCHECVHFQEI